MGKILAICSCLRSYLKCRGCSEICSMIESFFSSFNSLLLSARKDRLVYNSNPSISWFDDCHHSLICNCLSHILNLPYNGFLYHSLLLLHHKETVWNSNANHFSMDHILFLKFNGSVLNIYTYKIYQTQFSEKIGLKPDS